MTKQIFGSLLSHVAGLTQSVVELYKISTVGMSTFTWTDSNRGISFAGLTYSPWPVKRSKIQFSSDFRVDQTEITVAKNWGLERAIEKDLLAGANFEILRVRMDNPTSDYAVMFNGEVGNVQTSEIEFTIRGQTLDFLNVEVPKRDYQVMCNWKLYDQFCLIPVRSFLVGGCFSSTSPDSGKTLVATSFAGTTLDTFANNYWNQGAIRITTGENAEIRRQVTSHVGMSITVIPPFPFDITTLDYFEIIPGCAHDVTDCENSYQNLANYGGFPFIPRQDDIL